MGVKMKKIFVRLMATALMLTLLASPGTAYADKSGFFSGLFKSDTFDKGIDILTGFDKVTGEKLEQALEYFEESEDERSGEYVQLLKYVVEGEYGAASRLGAELVTKYPECEIDFIKMRTLVLGNYERNTERLSDWLGEYYVMRVFEDAENGAVTADRAAILEFIDDIDTLEPPKSSKDFPIRTVSSLYLPSAAAPDGQKIILFKSVRNYDVSSRETTVVKGFLDLLPIEFLPENAEDVDYIISLDYDYNIDGSYSFAGTVPMGVKAVRENGCMEITDINGQTISSTGNVDGNHAPGNVPLDGRKYFSGGPPRFGEMVFDFIESLS